MKFLILMYAEPGAWPPEDHRLALQESIELCHELHGRGQYLGASPLQPASTARTVRLKDGQVHVTDGPFAETKETLGGYFLVDVPSFEDAVALAARIPGTRRGTAEVRPILEVTGLPTPA